MSFFYKMLEQRGLSAHDGRPLWKYTLDENEFNELVEELQKSAYWRMDPKCAALYYAEWWKRNYDGGFPSKEVIFDSLGEKIARYIDSEEFYTLAKRGATILGIRWLKKQNTLYFRTLLLQGGLPIKHIRENESSYLNFLFAVLEDQPETVEDIKYNPEIVRFLPSSSQNEIIYENCFAIINSLWSKEEEYNDLFDSDSALQAIKRKLIAKKEKVKKKKRISRPRIHWIYTPRENSIHLSIGLAESYSVEDLNNFLNLEIKENEYQLFIDDQLICVFQKMINGRYSSQWVQSDLLEWDRTNNHPNVYVIAKGRKYNITDFIQIVPDLESPTLWSENTEGEWTLVKGSGSNNKSAALLFPLSWYSEIDYNIIQVYGQKMKWSEFEGAVQITNGETEREFKSSVKSFSWTVDYIKPTWLQRANLPVVRGDLSVNVYNDVNKRVLPGRYTVWVKDGNKIPSWEKLEEIVLLPSGCLDLKIEMDGIVGYDRVFSLGNFDLEFFSIADDQIRVKVDRNPFSKLELKESDTLSVETDHDEFLLEMKTDQLKIPNGIRAIMGNRGQRKLSFVIDSPFRGNYIVDADGNIISPEHALSLNALRGHRLLTRRGTDSFITIYNGIYPDVKITKRIEEDSQPLFSYKDDIDRVFYLGDVLNHQNEVLMKIQDDRESKKFIIKRFTHLISIDGENEESISIDPENENIPDAYGISVTGTGSEIETISLSRNENSYDFSQTELSQFIIVSSPETGFQLMPRFINLDPEYEGMEKMERIELYHQRLVEEEFGSVIWDRFLGYYNICLQHDIPFSTFDQLRAISRSSFVAAKAFFYLGLNSNDSNAYIQENIPKMEKDLGICFHWIGKEEWMEGLKAIISFCTSKYGNDFFKKFGQLVKNYFKNNQLNFLSKYVINGAKEPVFIGNQEVNNFRGSLGKKVLNELPSNCPRVLGNYGIRIGHHRPVKLLLQSPIAVAESILGLERECPIWGGGEIRERIRRNIQYSQYLDPGFYSKVIAHVINKSKP